MLPFVSQIARFLIKQNIRKGELHDELYRGYGFKHDQSKKYNYEEN